MVWVLYLCKECGRQMVKRPKYKMSYSTIARVYIGFDEAVK